VRTTYSVRRYNLLYDESRGRVLRVAVGQQEWPLPFWMISKRSSPSEMVSTSTAVVFLRSSKISSDVLIVSSATFTA
jgi:hypothetical protein